MNWLPKNRAKRFIKTRLRYLRNDWRINNQPERSTQRIASFSFRYYYPHQAHHQTHSAEYKLELARGRWFSLENAKLKFYVMDPAPAAQPWIEPIRRQRLQPTQLYIYLPRNIALALIRATHASGICNSCIILAMLCNQCDSRRGITSDYVSAADANLPLMMMMRWGGFAKRRDVCDTFFCLGVIFRLECCHCFRWWSVGDDRVWWSTFVKQFSRIIIKLRFWSIRDLRDIIIQNTASIIVSTFSSLRNTSPLNPLSKTKHIASAIDLDQHLELFSVRECIRNFRKATAQQEEQEESHQLPLRSIVTI